MNLKYINVIAPNHDKTSCNDGNKANARYSATDFGGCYRCTLLCAGESPEPKKKKDEVRKR